MLGHSHAIIGAAAGVGAATWLRMPAGFAAALAQVDVPLVGQLPNWFILGAAVALTWLLGALIGGIAGLLPDLDSHSSTLGALLPGVLHLVLPHHRQGSHSLLAVWVVRTLTYVMWSLLILSGAASAPPGSAPALAAVAASVAGQMALMVTVGYLSHLVADGITDEGCRWLYVPEFIARFLPAVLRRITEAHFGIPIFKTGTRPEPVFTYAFVAVVLFFVFDLQRFIHLLLPGTAAAGR